MLTFKEIAGFKATGADYQKADGGGLSLLVRASGLKIWRYEYRVNGKKEKYVIGDNDVIPAPDARKKRDELERLVKAGISPLEKEKLDELAKVAALSAMDIRPTFLNVLERYREEWLPLHWKHPDKRWAFIKRTLIPALGDKLIADITKQDIRALLMLKRETSGEATAIAMLRALRHIYVWAIEQDICEINPAAAIQSKGVGKTKKRERHLTKPEIKRYLTLIYSGSSYRTYRLGLHLLLMLGIRLNELVEANWKEFSEDGTEWTIPPSRMKGKREHTLILPRQAVELFSELQTLGNGSEWVFPMKSDPKRHMNGNNLGETHRAACVAGGIDDYVMHDHRHTVSTTLNGSGKFHPQAIESVLAHAVRGMAGVYDNGDYRHLRAEMLQFWADTLDGIVNEATVIRANFRKVA